MQQLQLWLLLRHNDARVPDLFVYACVEELMHWRALACTAEMANGDCLQLQLTFLFCQTWLV